MNKEPGFSGGESQHSDFENLEKLSADTKAAAEARAAEAAAAAARQNEKESVHERELIDTNEKEKIAANAHEQRVQRVKEIDELFESKFNFKVSNLSHEDVMALVKAMEKSIENGQKTTESEPASKEATNINHESLKKNQGLKEFLKRSAATAAMLALTGVIAVGSFMAFRNKGGEDRTTAQEIENSIDDNAENAEDEESKEVIKNVGELQNGVSYDYREYADFENKTSDYAFGYDKSDCFGDRDATADAWMQIAKDGPEYQGTYAYFMLTDSEKDEFGISGMTAKELDDYMSDAQNIDGGTKQRLILEKLDQIAHDKENTKYEFYHENDSEHSYYIVFDDKNGSGDFTPDELNLGYQVVERHNAPQTDVYRFIDNQWVKMIDLNMQCGFQANTETAPEGIPPITPNPNPNPNPNPSPEPTPPTPEPTPPSPEPTPPTPEPTPKPKDPENLERIDQKINNDIAEDNGTDKIVVTPSNNPGAVTEKPSSNNQQAPTIVQNDASKGGEQVQQQVSPSNNYSENKGGANSGEYAPVQENKNAQEAADKAATPVSEAPTGGQEMADTLDDLGIN